MNKPASMKDAMPETADWVNKMRAQWGRPYVDDCLRRGMAGEPGYFYAVEGGRVVGTPWMKASVQGAPVAVEKPADLDIVQLQQVALLFGLPFAGFMRDPVEGAS